MSLSLGMDGIAQALGSLASVAGVVGDSGTYYHKNDSGMTVYFFWGTSTTEQVDAGYLQSDIETLNLTMPRIAGITGLEPAVGDLIMDSLSRFWGIVSVKKLGLPTNPAAWLLAVTREAELNKTDG
jgi:hypothetical protein